jgi:hypothetical protein
VSLCLEIERSRSIRARFKLPSPNPVQFIYWEFDKMPSPWTFSLLRKHSDVHETSLENQFLNASSWDKITRSTCSWQMMKIQEDAHFVKLWINLDVVFGIAPVYTSLNISLVYSKTHRSMQTPCQWLSPESVSIWNWMALFIMIQRPWDAEKNDPYDPKGI